MRCPNCGVSVPAGDAFCAKCGVALAATNGVQDAGPTTKSDQPPQEAGDFPANENRTPAGLNSGETLESGEALLNRKVGQQPVRSRRLGRVTQALIWFVGIATLVGGLAYAHYVSDQRIQESMGIDPDMEEEGKAYIATLLRDPSSAQFRNVKSYHTCITGQVNGKNGFGGYGGFDDFFYDGTKKSGQIKSSTVTQSGSLAALQGVASDMDYANAQSDCALSAQKSETN